MTKIILLRFLRCVVFSARGHAYMITSTCFKLATADSQKRRLCIKVRNCYERRER